MGNEWRGNGLSMLFAVGTLMAALAYAPTRAAAQDNPEGGAPPADPPAADQTLPRGEGASTGATLEPGSTAATDGGPEEIGGLTPETGGRATAAPQRAERPPETLSHKYQVSIRFGIGLPYMFGLKYKGADNPRCDSDPEHDEWCRHFGVGMLDFDLGFGVSDAIEVSFSARFGLADEDATLTNPAVTGSPATGFPPLALGLGFRAYGSPLSVVKPFFGPRIILDLTNSDQEGWDSVDFGVRGEMGIQVDFVRWFGAYAQLGLSITFLRALMLVPDLSIGIQARFP